MNLGILSFFKYNKNIKKIFLLNFVSTFAIQGIFMVFIGIYIKSLGFGEGVVGNLLAINNIALSIGALLTPVLINRFGQKHSIIFGITLTSIGILGVSYFITLTPLFISIFLIGIGFSLPSTSIGVLLSEFSSNSERVDVFSTNFVFQCIASISGSYIAGHFTDYFGQFIKSDRSIPMLFNFSAFILFLGIIPILSLNFGKEKKQSKLGNIKASLDEILKGKGKNFLLYNTVIGFGAGLVVPFFSLYLKHSLSISDKSVGSIMAFSQVGLFIGGLSVPYVSKLLGKEKTVIVCQLLSIPFLISIAFPSSIKIVAVSFLLRSALMNLNQPLIQSVSMEIVSDETRTMMSSLISLTSNLTRAISVVIGGYIMEHFSYELPYAFTVTLYLTATYLFYKSFVKKN